MANLPVLGSEILDQRLRVAYEVYEATGPGDYVPLWPEQVAEEWVRRRQTDPPTELSAELGIKAMLLLARSRDENKGVRNRRWRQASEWTVEMGARALRSMHVEILVNEWLSHPDRRRRSDGLWVRLRQIEHSLQHPVSLDGVQGARHFGRAVFLRGSGALNAIAAGLSASIGEVPNPMLLCRTDLAPVTTRLAEVYRGLAPTGRPGRLWLQHSHVALLKQALSIIVSVERDVVLLSPPVIGGHPVEDAF